MAVRRATEGRRIRSRTCQPGIVLGAAHSSSAVSIEAPDIDANSESGVRHLSIQRTNLSATVMLEAVAMLTAETTRAGEHNRALEQRLTASAARISRLRHSLAEVKQEAATDALTGLVNRRGFDARLRRAMARAKADGILVSLLLVDVDHFKSFNDTYGHKTGDLVLRLVGRLLSENVKGKDTAARYGGEEFALILIGADARAGAVVAEQMRAVLDGKRLINKGSGQHMHCVTVSVGVAELQSGEGATALIGRADAALYPPRTPAATGSASMKRAGETTPQHNQLAPRAEGWSRHHTCVRRSLPTGVDPWSGLACPFEGYHTTRTERVCLTRESRSVCNSLTNQCDGRSDQSGNADRECASQSPKEGPGRSDRSSGA